MTDVGLQWLAILRFDQRGAVAQDYSSALLEAIQEQKTQPNEPEAAERCLDEYVHIHCTLSSQ